MRCEGKPHHRQLLQLELVSIELLRAGRRLNSCFFHDFSSKIRRLHVCVYWEIRFLRRILRKCASVWVHTIFFVKYFHENNQRIPSTYVTLRSPSEEKKTRGNTITGECIEFLISNIFVEIYPNSHSTVRFLPRHSVCEESVYICLSWFYPEVSWCNHEKV